jgi:hypothetical protein
MAQEIIDCDVVIQAGHENTPDDRTAAKARLDEKSIGRRSSPMKRYAFSRKPASKQSRKPLISSSRDRNIAAISRCSFISMTPSRRGRAIRWI